MIFLLAIDAMSAPYGVTLGLVGVAGFFAATVLGSIAWYNSKRPAGWEAKERPAIIPEIEN